MRPRQTRLKELGFSLEGFATRLSLQPNVTPADESGEEDIFGTPVAKVGEGWWGKGPPLQMKQRSTWRPLQDGGGANRAGLQQYLLDWPGEAYVFWRTLYPTAEVQTAPEAGTFNTPTGTVISHVRARSSTPSHLPRTPTCDAPAAPA